MVGVMSEDAKRIRASIKIPAGQTVWENRCDVAGNLVQIVTSDAAKTKWFLYNVGSDGKLTKVCTGDSPLFGQLRR